MNANIFQISECEYKIFLIIILRIKICVIAKNLVNHVSWNILNNGEDFWLNYLYPSNIMTYYVVLFCMTMKYNF